MKKIANYVGVGRYKSGGILGFGSRQIIIDEKDLWETIVIVIYNWLEPNTKERVIEKVLQSNPNITQDLLEKSIEIITKNNFLIEDGVYNSEDRYSRNKLYYNYSNGNPKVVQEKLNNSSVTIIGCGGIGNHVSVILATSGVKNFYLIDPDIVEISNLTRQVLFTEDDIGKSKVETLKRELLKRNNNLNITCSNKEITSTSDILKLPTSDIYVISADSPKELIDWVNEACVSKKQPYLAAGYINDISVIGPFYIPEETACFNCCRYVPDWYNDDYLKSEILSIDKIFKPATFAPVNNIAAAFAANDIIKFLGEFGEILSKNKRVGIHTNSIKTETQDYFINKECDVCQKNLKS